MKRFLFIPLLLLLFPSASLAAPPADTCPQIVPLSNVESAIGASGIKGYTVSRGTAPEEFDVDVLGVLQNQVVPGSKVIVARASGQPIEDAGGTSAAGMSGSPIYLPDGSLLGALAYGYSGTTDIIGITPAALMETAPSAKVVPDPKTRSLIGKNGTFLALPSPLYTSAHPSAVATFQRAAAQRGIRVVQGSAAKSSELVPGEGLLAGDSAVASFAVGRTSTGVLGTTTYVCEDRFAALGHLLLGEYQTRAIVSQAEIFAYITNPIWGSYKMGQATNTVGRMDFNGIHGISGQLGRSTPTVPYRAVIRDETSKRSFQGTMTEVVQMPSRETESFLLPDLAGASLGSEIVALTNRGPMARGSSFGGWTIRGTHGKEKFSFTRSNAWNGLDGPDGWFSYGTLGDAFAGDVYQILGFPSSKRTRIQSVRVNIRLRAGEQIVRLQKLSWKRPGGQWKRGAVRGVPRGGKFVVRLHLLRSWGGRENRTVVLRRTRDRGAFAIAPIRNRSPEKFPSFADMLRSLRSEANNRFRVRGRGIRVIKGDLRMNRVVQGSASLRIGRSPR